MTVKHSLNIQEVSIKVENQRSITIANPRDIVPKPSTKVHNEVLGCIIDKESGGVKLSDFTANSRVQSHANTVTISSVT